MQIAAQIAGEIEIETAELPQMAFEQIDRRFWRHALIGSDGCWEWQGARNARGYGVFFMGNDVKPRMWVASRVLWTILNGPIPSGLFVLHVCDNPPCIRPSHLFLGTKKDNHEDARKKGRIAPPPVRSGEAHSGSKLTSQDVLKIRSLRGVHTQKELAVMFGVAKVTIERVQYGTNWKSVGP